MAGEALVVIVRTPEEFLRWLEEASSAVQWIQVEGLLGEADAWATASRGRSSVALDVVMSDPESEYHLLYRLVDVSKVRDVRVTIPVRPGLLKAVRLAAAIHLPVRLLPGQPDEETLAELQDAMEFYLHDPMVEAPMEFFHSTLAWCRQGSGTDLWATLEQDPAVFPHLADDGVPVLPAERPGVTAAGFVDDHMRRMEEEKAECLSCRWRDFCCGYFKLPDPGYACAGIIGLLDGLAEAAREINAELNASETQAKPESEPPIRP